MPCGRGTSYTVGNRWKQELGGHPLRQILVVAPGPSVREFVYKTHSIVMGSVPAIHALAEPTGSPPTLPAGCPAST
jgi:hypothetical protein